MSEFLEIIKRACAEAGSEIMKFYNLNSFNVLKKEDNSFVTSADFAANEVILSYLTKTNIPICSEEKIDSNAHKLYWLVDPLDGTRNFIDKNGNFCICIALIKDGFPILSSIYLPTTRDFFYSFDGKNYKNSTLCLPQNNPNTLLINLGRDNQKCLNFANTFDLQIDKIGSAIKFTKFANLQNLIYLRLSNTYIWDTAAGELIVKNAGGLMIDLMTNKEIDYSKKELLNNSFLAVSKNNINKIDDILRYINDKKLI